MGRKKKDLEDAFFADFDALDEEGNVKEENEPAAPPTNKKEKKDKKNKKKGNNKKSLSNAFNSDDEGPELSLGMIPGGAQKNANDAKDSTEEEGEEEGEGNDQPLIAPPASTRRNGKKQKQKTSAFALLMEDEEGEDGGSSDEGQDADGDIQGDNDRGGLVVGQVLSVEPHPKADRLRFVESMPDKSMAS